MHSLYTSTRYVLFECAVCDWILMLILCRESSHNLKLSKRQGLGSCTHTCALSVCWVKCLYALFKVSVSVWCRCIGPPLSVVPSIVFCDSFLGISLSSFSIYFVFSIFFCCRPVLGLVLSVRVNSIGVFV